MEGYGQGESAWQYQPFPEMAANWTTETTALGGKGWQFLRYMDIPYLSTSAVTITFTVDTGNGSIALSTITLPSSGGTQTKSFTQLTPNKWKLIGFCCHLFRSLRTLASRVGGHSPILGSR